MRFLKDLAAATGGRLVVAEGDRDIGAAFGRVLDEFNSRYVLTYTPAGVTGQGWHRIDLKLKRKKGTVTARRGYFGARALTVPLRTHASVQGSKTPRYKSLHRPHHEQHHRDREERHQDSRRRQQDAERRARRHPFAGSCRG